MEKDVKEVARRKYEMKEAWRKRQKREKGKHLKGSLGAGLYPEGEIL